ncbi:MAG: hypothetical protein KF823_11480 [Xanthomonadales bacterium]|nr:hypothetical protein [Xanthomonadales bacterium]
MTATLSARSALLALLLAAPATWAAWPDTATSTSEILPRAANALLLDGLRMDDGRLLVVGERGHVLLSDDLGATWSQAATPTRATLTAVAGHGTRLVAGGHDGVLLHSADGGATWARVREMPWDPASDDPTSGAPVLDILFLDADRVLAIGAYSLLLESNDGGATWQQHELQAHGQPGAADEPAETADDADGIDDGGDPLLFDESELMLDAEEDPHLNAIARLDSGRLFIVAERGAGFVSDDDGATWRRTSLPYDGSMFGLLPLDQARVLAFGLRGNALISEDEGDTWTPVETGTDLSLFGGARRGGGIVLVGANGLLLEGDAGARGFRATTLAEAGVLAAVIDLGADGVLLLGEYGQVRHGGQP